MTTQAYIQARRLPEHHRRWGRTHEVILRREGRLPCLQGFILQCGDGAVRFGVCEFASVKDIFEPIASVKQITKTLQRAYWKQACRDEAQAKRGQRKPKPKQRAKPKPSEPIAERLQSGSESFRRIEVGKGAATREVIVQRKRRRGIAHYGAAAL